MRWIRNIFFTNKFFYILFGLVALFVLGFIFPSLFIIGKAAFLVFCIAWAWDILFLYGKKHPIKIERNYPDKFSNGDLNDFELQLRSHYPTPVKIRCIEELPVELQVRNFEKTLQLTPDTIQYIHYQLHPVKRGAYIFGKCNVIVRHLGLVERKIALLEPLELPSYPSFIQLRKFLLMATTNNLEEIGVKRIRRIGNTMEFDRIKEYGHGDEYRFINWKATGKMHKLMVNQYQDERSQPIYSFIDTGRSMRMPFEEMTLLDYAINATLVLSNVSIYKKDKAGMLTFSKDIKNHVVASKRNHQMHLISETLYRIRTDFTETEFGRLYAYSQRKISQRSLIFIYTNFETKDALHRQLPYLRLLNRSHIIITIVFKNTELVDLAHQGARKTLSIYNQIIAEKFNYEKELIVQELQANGIQTIFTKPKDLTINAINKYLEIKARGLI